MVLSNSARHEEAQAAVRRAHELDPLAATDYALSAQVAFNARDYQAALTFARRALDLNPEFWIARYQLALAGC